MNYIISINGVTVPVSPKVYHKITVIARERKISFDEAVLFCFQKVN